MDGPTRAPIDRRGDGHDCAAGLIATIYQFQTRRMEGKRARLGSGWTDIAPKVTTDIAPRVIWVKEPRGIREGRPVSLRLDKATIAKIEADRIYDLILPETAGKGKDTVTVPLSYLQNVLTTGQNLEGLAPAYVRRALERLSETAKIHRFRRKAVIPKESLAFVAAAFRKAAESAERRPS